MCVLAGDWRRKAISDTTSDAEIVIRADLIGANDETLLHKEESLTTAMPSNLVKRCVDSEKTPRETLLCVTSYDISTSYLS